MNNNWQSHKISDVCQIVNGKTPLRSNSDFWDNGTINWFTIDDLRRQGRFIGNTTQHITRIAVDKSGIQIVPKNSVLVCCTASVGEVAFTTVETSTNQQFNSLVPNDSTTLDSLYLYYATDYISPQLKQIMGTTTFGFVSKSKLGDLVIKVPEITIQRKVADIFSTIDKLIQKSEQIIKNTELLKQGVISDLFEKGKNNKDWKLLKLNKITKKITDGTHKTPRYIDEGVPFLRINDIQNHDINWSKTKYISREEHIELIKRCHPEKGDILLSKNGTIGITKIVTWDREFSIFVSLCLIKPDLNLVLSDYLGIVIGSDYVLMQGKMRSKQGTVTNLHLEEIRDFDIPLPNKTEQEKIIAAVSSVEIQLEKETLQRNNLIKLKLGLMQDIFSQKVAIN